MATFTSETTSNVPTNTTTKMATTTSTTRPPQGLFKGSLRHGTFMKDASDLWDAIVNRRNVAKSMLKIYDMGYSPLRPLNDFVFLRFERGAAVFFPMLPLVGFMLLSGIRLAYNDFALLARGAFAALSMLVAICMLAFASSSIRNLGADLKKENIPPTRIDSIVVGAQDSLDLVYLFLLKPLIGTCFGWIGLSFYSDLFFTLAMVTCIVAVYHVQVSYTIDAERKIKKAEESKKQYKLDQKDKKIAGLETIVEGLHQQLHVMREVCEQEKQQVADEIEAEALQKRREIIDEFDSALDDIATKSKGIRETAEMLENTLEQEKHLHNEQMAAMGRRHAQELDSVSQACKYHEEVAKLLKGDLDDMVASQAADIARLAQEHDEELANATARHDVLRQQNQELNDALVEEERLRYGGMDDMAREHSEELEQLRDDVAAETRAFVLAEAKKEAKKQLQQVKDAYETSVHLKAQSHLQALEAKDQQHAAAIAALEEQRQQAQQKEHEGIAELGSRIFAKHEAELATKDEQHAAAIAALEEQHQQAQKKGDEAIAELRSRIFAKHEAELTRKDELRSISLAVQATEFDAILKKKNDDYEQMVAEKDTQHAAAHTQYIEKLRQKTEECEHMVAEKDKQHNRARLDIIRLILGNVAKFRQHYINVIDKAKSQNDSLRKEQYAHAKECAEEKEQTEAKIAGLQKQIDTLCHEKREHARSCNRERKQSEANILAIRQENMNLREHTLKRHRAFWEEKEEAEARGRNEAAQEYRDQLAQAIAATQKRNDEAVVAREQEHRQELIELSRQHSMRMRDVIAQGSAQSKEHYERTCEAIDDNGRQLEILQQRINDQDARFGLVVRERDYYYQQWRLELDAKEEEAAITARENGNQKSEPENVSELGSEQDNDPHATDEPDEAPCPAAFEDEEDETDEDLPELMEAEESDFDGVTLVDSDCGESSDDTLSSWAFEDSDDDSEDDWDSDFDLDGFHA